MSRVKRWALLFTLLLISTAISGFGAWLFYASLLKGHRKEAEGALFILFGGATLVPAVLVALGNRFIKSERTIPYREPRSKVAIKKRERLIRRMHFLKRRPIFVFLFIIVALLVSSGMIAAPYWTPHPHDPGVHFLHLFGIVLFLAYFMVLLFFIYGIFTNKWEPYMDASIQKLEKQLADAKALPSANPLV